MGRIDNFCEKFADKLIWILILVYASVFSYICFLKYASFNYHDWDFASDVSILWNSVHGKMLYYPFLEENIFGAHLYLIILLFVPVYAVFQHPLTLLFMQSLFLGLGAYPLYLLARLLLDKTTAITVSIIYLLYPSLGYINLFETHFEIYAIFFLFFALYYFEKEKFRYFLLFSILAMMCKENVSIAVFMLGIYAAIRRRPLKWILIPTVFSLFWFLLSVRFIIPYFAKDARMYQEGFMFGLYYGHLGSTLLEIVKNIILHPVQVMEYALSPAKVIYIAQVLLPTSFLVFLSPETLFITIPVFMQNLLSAAPTHSQIYFQYVALLVPFIFYSFVHALRRIFNESFWFRYKAQLIIVLLIVAVCSAVYLKAPQLYPLRYIKQYKIDDLSRKKEELIRVIPKNAAVISTFQFMPKLAERRDLYSMHLVSTGLRMYTQVKYEPPVNLEYALIDFNEPLMINCFFPPDAPGNIRHFLENGGWKVFDAVNDIVLFKKGCLGGYNLCEYVQEPAIEHQSNVNIAHKFEFFGYDITQIGSGKDLRLTYYWKPGLNYDEPLGLVLRFVDSHGVVRLDVGHSLGYRIYPSSALLTGMLIKERHNVLIPSYISAGKYKIMGVIFALNSGKILPVDAGASAEDGRAFVLGDVLIGQ